VNGGHELGAVDRLDEVYKQLVDEPDQGVRGALRNPQLVEQLEAVMASTPGDAAMCRFADGCATAEDVELLEESGIIPPGVFEQHLAWLERREAVRQETPEAMLKHETRRHLRLLHNYRGIAAQRVTSPAPRRRNLRPPVAASLMHRLVGRAPRSRAVRAQRQPRDPARPQDEPPLDSAGPR
jgi:hypothetical protein